MAVYCDVCGKQLSANDESIYTPNGGALCPDHQLTLAEQIMIYEGKALERQELVELCAALLGITDIAMPESELRECFDEAMKQAVRQ